MFVYLPNSNGAYTSTRIPQYVLDILEQVKTIGCYAYRLQGINPIRPAYGVVDDINKLQNWAQRHNSVFNIKHINKQPKNYFVDFVMSDPVVLQLEKARLLSERKQA